MRSVLSATLMIAASGFTASHAQAQMTPPSTVGAKAKSVTTVPIRPALQKPEDTARALGQAGGSSDAKACGSRDLCAEVGHSRRHPRRRVTQYSRDSSD
jgi:hypothetical protein